MSTETSKQHTYRAKLNDLYTSTRTTTAIADTTDKRNKLGTNAGLWLDKYIKNQSRQDTSSRGELMKEVTKIAIPQSYKQFYQQWEHMLKGFGVLPQHMQLARTKGRMMIGLGEESVLETSIALHHTYGVPYIPGSALKGLAASYARQRLGKEWQKERSAYQTIFGDMRGAGGITFFDALLYIDPNQVPEKVLYQDTITVHHPGYYQGKKDSKGKLEAPSDWDSPTPIPFLSATGSYLIALAAPDLENGDQWIDTTFEILGYALEEMGIGAKTSSGYGRMALEYLNLDEETRRCYEERKRQQNEERQRLQEEERQKVETERQRLQEESKRTAVEKQRVEGEKQSVERWKEEIERLSIKNIASDMPGYYNKWRGLTSDENKLELATAIIAKVLHSGSEKNMLKKNWYQEIVAYVDKMGQ